MWPFIRVSLLLPPGGTILLRSPALTGTSFPIHETGGLIKYWLGRKGRVLISQYISIPWDSWRWISVEGIHLYLFFIFSTTFLNPYYVWNWKSSATGDTRSTRVYIDSGSTVPQERTPREEPLQTWPQVQNGGLFLFLQIHRTQKNPNGSGRENSKRVIPANGKWMRFTSKRYENKRHGLVVVELLRMTHRWKHWKVRMYLEEADSILQSLILVSLP